MSDTKRLGQCQSPWCQESSVGLVLGRWLCALHAALAEARR